MPYKPRSTNRYKRRPLRRMIAKKPKVSKGLRKAINTVVAKKIETKTINCPDPTSGLLPKNTVDREYLAASGVMYLVNDVFRCPQGVADSTVIGSANRIGDKVQGLGFMMNYYFHTCNLYTLGNIFQIPWIKLRICVIKTAFGFSPLTYQTVFDTNFLNVSTYTLQPIDKDEGYIKEVLYDDVIIIRNQASTSDTVSKPNDQLIYNNVFHFKKYIKYDRPIRYMDNNSTDPTGTNYPISILITAEIDDSFVGGIPPSNTPLLRATGYTQAWFKDA